MQVALNGLDGEAAPVFLGVERSLGGRRWLLRDTDERLALALSQRFDLPDVVGRLLAARRVDLESAENFLNSTLRALLPDPMHLMGMKEAVERLLRAIEKGERIAIFGDYDVDGATSTALLKLFLAAVGVEAGIYIPDRMIEGYGPNAEALLRLRREGYDLVLTVDCGISSFDALDAAQGDGLDVIVIDHHVAEARLPNAVAVVNPNRLDDTSSYGYLAAVGVVFLLVVALNRTLREKGFYTGNARSEPDLRRWLDIVALGTVCDMVPLIGVNRALVTQGLRVMGRRGNPGLTALADVGGIQKQIDAYHLGFVLGPRINAGGRVGVADLGARLLSSTNATEAMEIAKRLDACNRERQEVEAAVLLEAIEQVESAPVADGVVMVAGENWHPGVIGIVAGRLKERYGRPTCVIAFDGNEGKGSGRSVPGYDLGTTIIAARQAGLLLKGGGHAMAVGFTVGREMLRTFHDFVNERLTEQVAGEVVPVLELDGALDVGGANARLVDSIQRCAPFGSGNAEPRFVIRSARVTKADIVGMGHVRCFLVGETGSRLKAIAFRSVDSELGSALLNGVGSRFHLAGCLRLDSWQGQDSVQLLIDDAAPAR